MERETMFQPSRDAVRQALRQFAGSRTRRRRRTFLFTLAVVVAVVGMGVFASAAAADQPVVSYFPATFTATLTDACSFPIDVESTAQLKETDFVDQSGATTRILFQGTEQDTFSANGNTLVGVPFHLDVAFVFDSSGNVTHIFGQGITEIVRLPDGSLFLAAGRVDFVAHGNPAFLLTPDVGTTVNLTEFCAALAP
jgi:hypothetical protein